MVVICPSAREEEEDPDDGAAAVSATMARRIKRSFMAERLLKLLQRVKRRGGRPL